MLSDFEVTSLIGGDLVLKELECYFDYFVGKRTEEIGQVILMKNLYYRELVNSKRSSFEEMIEEHSRFMSRTII